MDIHEILKYLPHRGVDRVLSCEPGKDITALKKCNNKRAILYGYFQIIL